MANKSISELTEATVVNEQDLFVLEQGGLAKKMTAETFITAQNLVAALAAALDGHGGIASVALASVSGRIRTYRITFSDGSATTFQVYDGTSIDRISRTSSSGLDDVYTVFLSDGTTTFFTVHNGADGDVSETTLNSELAKKAPAITETTESSAIANFTDGADDMVMHNVVAEINPVQSGSGDPSPSNIRPISGWTGCNVTSMGKNLLPIFKDSESTQYGLTMTPNEDGSIRVHGTATNTAATLLNMRTVSIPIKAGTYTFSNGISNTSNKVYCQVVSSGHVFYSRFAKETYTFATDSTITRLDIGVNAANGEAIDVTIYPQLEVGSSATAYEPYITPSTVSLSWQTEAGTVYGGTIDVTTGLLTVTDGYIASYNGETLPSTWISDRDVYASGTTPTTGAEVVYKLATPQTYQLTGQQLKTLYGTNNVWADTGNVTVKYPADTKMYIDNAIAALA